MESDCVGREGVEVVWGVNLSSQEAHHRPLQVLILCLVAMRYDGYTTMHWYPSSQSFFAYTLFERVISDEGQLTLVSLMRFLKLNLLYLSLDFYFRCYMLLRQHRVMGLWPTRRLGGPSKPSPFRSSTSDFTSEGHLHTLPRWPPCCH